MSRVLEKLTVAHLVKKLEDCFTSSQGRAVAQAVSRWLPIAAARVRARVWSCGICGGQSGAGAGFLLPIFIPPISPQSPSSIIWGWYSRSVVAAVPSGLSLTPLTIVKENNTSSQEPTAGCYPKSEVLCNGS
jgi:hypothetical protein